MASLLVLHGPNLNLLGTREPALYGSQSLTDIDKRLAHLARSDGHELTSMQSNSESDLIERIHLAGHDGTEIILFNPAAFSHTSIALRDALLGVALPFIEIHISNVYQREPFRHQSYFSDIAVGVIAGLGVKGYELAYHAAIAHLRQSDTLAMRPEDKAV